MTSGYSILDSPDSFPTEQGSIVGRTSGIIHRRYTKALGFFGSSSLPWTCSAYVIAIALLLFFALGLFSLTVYYWESIVPWLNNTAESIRTQGVTGYALMSAVVFVFCFPPLMGYGTLLYFNGFVFRFPMGIIPVFVGSAAGAFVGFVLGRRWLQPYRSRWLSQYPNFGLIEKAVERGGIKLLVIIRLAPYPFGVSNILFSATKLKLSTFMTATCIALFRNLIHVYIGSTFASFAELKDQKSPAQFVPIVISFCLAICALVYLTFKVRAILNEERISDDQVGVLGAIPGPVAEEIIIVDREQDLLSSGLALP